MKSITQNYVYNFIYQIVVLLIPIFLSPYLAQTLGPKNLGIYGYIYSICNIISTISLIGSYNFGIRQIAYYRDNIKQFTSFFWELFWLRLILGCISLIIYFIIAYTSDYFIYFILFSGWLIAGIIDTSWFFIGMEDMKPTILKNFLVKISSIILIFIAVKREEDLYIYILIMSMTMFVSTSILLFQIKKYIKKSLGFYDEKISPYKIFVKDILYIEFLNRKSNVHTIGGNIITTNCTLKYWYDRLNTYGFAYSYKAYLINFEYISAFNKNEIVLINNETIPLSRHYKKEFDQKYNDFLHEML